MSDLHEDAENMESTDQENIIMNIFTLCDIEKTGLVPVSKLIEFISPYIDFNSAHLEELRKSLDPLQKDPHVTNKVFFKSMKEWTDKFKNEFQANCTPTEIIDPNSKRLSDVDQRQSTPTKNFARGFFKGEYESGILNLSNISSYSYAGSTAGAFDPGILQEQINELQHQNRKLNEMLSDVRVQLNVSEEQNGALQNDMERITKRLLAEQKVNEHLQKERKENDEYRENTNNIIKKYETLNQNLISYKKENAQLKNQIIDCENEVQKLQEAVTKVRNNNAKKTQTIEELKIEVEIREKEIATLEECKRQLNQICKDKEDGIQQLIDETQHLQCEKIALEKRLSEVITRSATSLQQEQHEIPGKKSLSYIPIKLRRQFSKIPHSSTPLPITPNIDATETRIFTFDSPMTRLINNKGTLNSPKLLKMLANPISPISAPTPTFNTCIFRYSTSETVACKGNYSTGTDSSLEYLSPIPEGSKDSCQTSENVSVIENTAAADDERDYVVYSLQTQPRNSSAEKECQISPSSCEKSTQTPPRKLHLNTFSSPQRMLSKSINEQQLTPIKESRLSCSNPNIKFTPSASSPEPESLPAQRISKSLSPNVSSDDDDHYWGSVISTVQPYESLQSELMQMSTGVCVGPCDHKMKQTQYEQEIESLQCELKQHENCQNAIEKYERELRESKERMEKYENDMKALQRELDEAKTERNTETLEKLREFEEKFTNAQQEKENEIIKLKATEEELRKQYEGKTKELANLKCEVRKFGEKVDNCKLELQRSMCDKAMFEEELKKAKEFNEIYEEQCRVATKNLEDMMKKIQANDNEKEELTKDVEERDREKSELINSNRNLLEQMTMYKENYLLVQQEFSSLNEDYCRKKEELNEAKEQFEQLNDEFEKISSKYEENEKKLKEMQQATEDDTMCKEENLKLKADCEKLAADLEAKTQRIETLEKECSAMKVKNEENETKLHAFNTAMEEKVQKIHEEHALKMKEIISYQENKMKQFDWLIVQKSGLEDALDAYEMKYKDATEKLMQAEELRTSYKDALAKLKESENQILKLQEDLEDTMAQIDSLEMAQEKAEIKWIKADTIMKEKITALETELCVVREKLTESKSISEDPAKTMTCTNCSNLDIERKSANAKMDTRRSTRVELLHHKIEKLDEQLDEEKNRTKSLAESLTKVQSEKDDLETKLLAIEDEQKQLLLQKDAGQTRIKKLTRTVQGLELKVNTYKNTIGDISRQVEFRTKDMAQMEMRFSDLQLKSNKISYAHSLLVTHLGVVRQKIVDQKKMLGGNTLYAVNVWRTLLENVSPTSPVLKEDPSELVTTTSDSTAGPLDEEIHNLGQQINLTCILLKTLAKLRDHFQTPTEHGDGSRARMEKSVDTGNESLLSAVIKRKFVLKPASFILQTNPLNTSPMSPDSPAAEMADVPSPKEHASPRAELNNNDIQMDQVKLRSNGEVKKSLDNEARKSFASDLTDSGSTSSDSGSSESLGIEVVAKRYMEPKERLSAGESRIENEKEVQEGLARQFRSMSEGAVVTHQLTDDGDVTVFPNLRDNVLETLGLLPDGQSKERLSEDEIEVKFQTLTLAFAIDAVTLADRRDRQKRQRDQAEDNMATEVARLTYAIHRLNPLCIDAETTEMVTSLLSQLDVILQASNRISTSAEVFGSVQQEWRLAESVNVMLSHLRNLRQQRDTARRQLQCTKRMLQESTTTTEPTNSVSRPRISSTNGRVVTRRRASIATITRPLESPRGGTGANGCAVALADGTVTRRGTTRRTSAAVCEPSSRHWDSRVRQDWSPVDRPATLLRSRPSRLELGVDLVKIKEGAAESSTSDSFEKYDSDTDFRTPTAISDDTILQDEVAEPTTFRGHVKRKLLRYGAQIDAFWNYLVEEGTIHEVCCVGAIICFALSTIIIGNLLLEVEHARRGIPMQRIPLEWLTWDELLKLIFGDPPTTKGPY